MDCIGSNILRDMVDCIGMDWLDCIPNNSSNRICYSLFKQGEMKQTAVEWLVEQIENDSDTIFYDRNIHFFEKYVEQAKQMEKDELASALSFGYMDGVNNTKTWKSFEEYYKWRYNK